MALYVGTIAISLYGFGVAALARKTASSPWLIFRKITSLRRP
jgi:hypothetical protein